MELDPGSGSGEAHSPSTAQPTPMEWGWIRPRFEDLYVTQDLPLPVVKKRLLDEDGFDATDRMFRRKIRSWYLDKYKKKVEMSAVFRRLQLRESRGQKSYFIIRKRVVTSEEVYAYIRKNGLLHASDPSVDDNAIWRRGHITCHTPIGSPRLAAAANMATNDQGVVGYALPAAVSPVYLDTVSNNLLHSLERHICVVLKPTNHGFEDVDNQYGHLEFGSEFLKFHDLLGLGKQSEAFAILDDTFAMTKPLLRAGHPHLLTYLLESIAFSRSVGQKTVARNLITLFTSMSRQVLGLTHPITVFVASLGHADGRFLNGIIEVALHCMTDQFSARLGAGHTETMTLLLTSSAILKHQRSYHQASARLGQLLTLYEQAFGPNSHQASHALSDYAVVKTEMGDFDDAGLMMEEAMHRAEHINNVIERTESRIRCLLNLSAFYKAQCEVEQMVQNLQLAIRIGDGTLSEEHWIMRHVRAKLAEVPPVMALSTPGLPIAGTGGYPVTVSSSPESMCILTPTSDFSVECTAGFWSEQ